MRKTIVSKAVRLAIEDGQYIEQAKKESKKWSAQAKKQGFFSKLLGKLTGEQNNDK